MADPAPWPQVILLIALTLIAAGSLVAALASFDDDSDTRSRAVIVFLGCAVLALLLGAGGFWEPLRPVNDTTSSTEAPK